MEAICYSEIDKLPDCIINIILDYFSKEIKDTCAGIKIKDSEQQVIIQFDPQWMIKLIHNFKKHPIFELNAKFGYLDNMKWLLKNKFTYGTMTFANAALNGNLDNMKWLFENKFPYDRWTFIYSAKNGNLDNMKWLFEHKFPCDEWTFIYSAKNGNLDNMKWLFENKFPYDERTFAYAVSNESHSSPNSKYDQRKYPQNLENMKWLLENKFPYDKKTKKKLINLGLLKNRKTRKN